MMLGHKIGSAISRQYCQELAALSISAASAHSCLNPLDRFGVTTSTINGIWK